ncbi:Ribosome maturation factor RimP [Actinomyces bovis]|uniref:Ribosome maturation factor RimP n=1 Tax=Actinomyces bovis TaxID=1658 RepID=A0ABY1VLD9_9ACTO|nr:ribosome maturation factor RimP [Actinomyces bovis]SPT52628.1 Ribosome maturation factor RimP [Actinomyces bovis]VEG54497.1 Ribosome maturation factor RimP [Actinomyces israelii]
MAENLAQTLTELLAPVLAEAGLFLENVETTRAGKYSTVRVIVDLPDGPGDIDLDTIAEATTAVSQTLDTADPVKGQYTLEVSSPGAERKLSTPRHFRRAQGRTVQLQLDDGEQLIGVLKEAQADSLNLEVDGASRAVPSAQIKAAKVVVVF